MSHEDEPTMSEGRALSRRTVVRAGAHAAWVIPAVSLVTAAPALAASNHTLQFTATSAAKANNGNGQPYTPTVTFTLHNNSAATTTAGLQVTITFPSTAGNITPPASVSGWSISPTTVQNAPASFTLTRTTQLAGGADATFSGVFTSNDTNKNVSGSVSFTANTSNFPAATGSAVIA